jgi:hypothetical protein
MNAKRAAFHFFTYTIHQTPSPPRLLLEDVAQRFGIDTSSPASVFKKKNEIFESCVWDAAQFFHPKRKSVGTIILKANQIQTSGTFLLKIGCEKKAVFTDKDLVDHVQPNFPYVYTCFDNRPNKQIIAIEHKPSVFSDPKVVAKIIQENANSKLAPFNLQCTIKQQFDDNDFWKFVAQHPKTIARLQFLIMAPNLPRIAESVPESFNLLQSSVGSQCAKIDLHGLANGHLTIAATNRAVAGLAKAAADGGGEIKVALKGYKRLKTMSKTTRETTIEEFHAEGEPNSVLSVITEMMGKMDE